MPAKGSRKPTAEKRTENLQVKLSPTQKEAVVRAARRATLDLSVWARMVLLRETDWNPDDDS